MNNIFFAGFTAKNMIYASRMKEWILYHIFREEENISYMNAVNVYHIAFGDISLKITIIHDCNFQ